MTDSFWAHIDTLGGAMSEHGAEQLATVLAEAGSDEVTAFVETLRAMKALLDTAEFSRAANELADDGTGLPFSDDALEDLQYAVIAAGRNRFEAIVADLSQVAGAWDVECAEDLSAVPGRAMDLLPEPSGEEPAPDPVVRTAGGTDAASDPWVQVMAGIHCRGHALAYALMHAGMWERLEGIADSDETLTDARRSGRIPRVDIDLQYFAHPAMAAEMSLPLGREAKVRRYRNRWEVRVWRDASSLQPQDTEQMNAEVQDLVDAVMDALRVGLAKPR